MLSSCSLNEAIDIFMNNQDESDLESSSSDGEYNLAMLLPNEKSNAVTDMDSDASDDMNEGLVNHLPRSLLNSACRSSLLNKQNKEKAVKAKKPPKNNQHSNMWEMSLICTTLKVSESGNVPEEWKETIKTPADAFSIIFSK